MCTIEQLLHWTSVNGQTELHEWLSTPLEEDCEDAPEDSPMPYIDFGAMYGLRLALRYNNVPFRSIQTTLHNILDSARIPYRGLMYTVSDVNHFFHEDDGIPGPWGSTVHPRTDLRECIMCDEIMFAHDSYHTVHSGPYCEGHYFEARDEEEDEYNSDVSSELSGYHTNVLHRCRGFRGASNESVRAYRTLFVGVELEFAAEEGQNIRDLKSATNGVAIFCHDGSLPTNGAEMKTIPATMRWHETHWEKAFSILYDTCTTPHSCGMHVHVSRRPIGAFTIGKLLCFMNNPTNRGHLSTIAGRDLRHSEYCPTKPDHAKLTSEKDAKHDRYAALNVCPSDTIEFRIFASTTSRERYLQNIEFCLSAIHFCRTHSPGKQLFDEYRLWLAKNASQYPRIAEFVKTYCK